VGFSPRIAGQSRWRRGATLDGFLSLLQNVRILVGCENFGARLCEPQLARALFVLRKPQRGLDLGYCCGSQSRAPLVAASARCALLLATRRDAPCGAIRGLKPTATFIASLREAESAVRMIVQKRMCVSYADGSHSTLVLLRQAFIIHP